MIRLSSKNTAWAEDPFCLFTTVLWLCFMSVLNTALCGFELVKCESESENPVGVQNILKGFSEAVSVNEASCIPCCSMN